jgi:Xaa-Pro aminopeptidase
LESILRANGIGLASEIIGPLRMRKSKEEIDYLREAASIADAVLHEVLGEGIEGLTELELAAQLEYEMKKRGAEELAFETLVASGPNSAFPHHRAQDRVIEEGDVVVIDYGCRFNGYHSDTTRTVVCGVPSTKVEEVYRVVQRAQEKAVQAIRPGIAAEEIDRVAREEIAQAGFGDNFIHRTGHGIGLEVHEAPFIVAGNRQLLEPGMTFSVEPGIYISGEFGVRIEDIVLVTDDGVERLNRNRRELQEIG